LCARLDRPAPKLAVSLDCGVVRLEDWIDRLRTGGGDTASLEQVTSKVLGPKDALRGDKLLVPWLRQLASAAMDQPVTSYLVARDAVLTLAPLDPATSRAQLAALAALWRANLDRPLAVACKTAFALLQGAPARPVYDGGFSSSAEVDDPCLARLWPDYAALAAGGDLPANAQALYGPLVQWMDEQVQVAPMDRPDDDAEEAA
jgi:exodeoxyribonuclease V gamma subunit